MMSWAHRCSVGVPGVCLPGASGASGSQDYLPLPAESQRAIRTPISRHPTLQSKAALAHAGNQLLHMAHLKRQVILGEKKKSLQSCIVKAFHQNQEGEVEKVFFLSNKVGHWQWARLADKQEGGSDFLERKLTMLCFKCTFY